MLFWPYSDRAGSQTLIHIISLCVVPDSGYRIDMLNFEEFAKHAEYERSLDRIKPDHGICTSGGWKNGDRDADRTEVP